MIHQNYNEAIKYAHRHIINEFIATDFEHFSVSILFIWCTVMAGAATVLETYPISACKRHMEIVVIFAMVLDPVYTVYAKKYAHGFCFVVLCCGYTLTDFPIPIRLTSLALWQSNDCPSASKTTLMNMDKYFMWIHYERLHNPDKAKHNKTVCIFLGIYCRRGSIKLHRIPP